MIWHLNSWWKTEHSHTHIMNGMHCFGISSRWSFFCLRVLRLHFPRLFHFEICCFSLLIKLLSICLSFITCAPFPNTFCTLLLLWLTAILSFYVILNFVIYFKKNKFYFPEITLTILKIQLYTFNVMFSLCVYVCVSLVNCWIILIYFSSSLKIWWEQKLQSALYSISNWIDWFWNPNELNFDFLNIYIKINWIFTHFLNEISNPVNVIDYIVHNLCTFIVEIIYVNKEVVILFCQHWQFDYKT